MCYDFGIEIAVLAYQIGISVPFGTPSQFIFEERKTRKQESTWQFGSQNHVTSARVKLRMRGRPFVLGKEKCMKKR